MARRPSPLLGYNTNLRHAGKVYHVQTEDSGVDRPHVITHLFADGGRIVDSRKTEYKEHVGAENLQEIVKKLMQGQHKAMCISLRDGEYDDVEKALANGAGAEAAEDTVVEASADEGSTPARAALDSASPRSTLAYEQGAGTGSSAPTKQRTSRAPKKRTSGAPKKRASRAPKKHASKAPPRREDPTTEPLSDTAAFERAAEQRLAESNLTSAPAPRRPVSTPLGRMKPRRKDSKKLVDDVILDYLDKDEKEDDKA